MTALACFLTLVATVPELESSHDVTTQRSRSQNLLEYVAGRTDLGRTERRAWEKAVRARFGGAALRDGSDEGVTVAKSVVAAAVFFGVAPVRGADAAYHAYHDAAHRVPPPIAINYQVLAFQGRRPAVNARRMALDFPKHFDRDIAPELIRWWDQEFAAGRVPAWERRQVRAALEHTRAMAGERPASDKRIWTLDDRGHKKQVAERTGLLRHRGEWRVALGRAVARWIGTPYRMGGTTRRGVDCSAFVRAVYRDVFAVEIPRNSRAQHRVGQPVRRRDLAPGDLVFFDTLDRGRVTHVGVYLGDGVFAHASSSRGVTRARLGERYYQRAWIGARRLFAAPTT
jgi:cell wall-associated NlpC family hydrolase